MSDARSAVEIRSETAAELDAIRDVNRQAFGNDDEPRLVDALRDGGFARVSLVALQGAKVVGHILFSDLLIVTSNGDVAALALAPLAVLPEFQRLGIGSRLVRQGLDECRAKGHRIVIVLGHADYYPRFGFTTALAKRLESPYAGDHFMATELVPGALNRLRGRVEYPPPFSGL